MSRTEPAPALSGSTAARTLIERHPKIVAAVWAVLVLLAIGGAANQTSHLTSGGFDVPGSQSRQVEEKIRAHFPEAAAATLAVVVQAGSGAGEDALSEAVAEAHALIGDLPGVSFTADASAAPGSGGQSEIHVIPLVVTGGQDESIDVAKDLARRLGIRDHHPATLADGRASAYLTGQGALYTELQSESTGAVAKGELITLPVVSLVLLLIFGSVLAMALPLGVGVAAVVITGGITFLLAQLISMSVFVSNAVSMVGIGVAVDYTLFMLVRFRSEVQGGSSLEQARRTALATSGRAAVLSGCTVVLALASLFLIDSTAMRSIAIGTIAVVGVAMAATVTLVPAVITLLGPRLVRRRRSGAPDVGDDSRFWRAWSDRVMRHPVRFVVLAGAVLLVLAAPTVDLSMGNSVFRQLPADNQARIGTELAHAALGPGAGDPVQVYLGAERPGDRLGAESPEVAAVVAIVDGTEGIGEVLPAVAGDDGRGVLVQAVATVDAESPQAREIVRELRAALAETPGVDAAIGGTTASIMDFDDQVSRAMVRILAFMVVAGFLLLTVVLRSPVLAAKAVVMNLLSLAAAYGVLVAVFQWGWLSWLGLDPAPTVDTITPPLILAITFGLSMDYEIFLLSRIRERWEATGDNARAVGEGLAGSARSISGAALIMVLVFLAFVLTGFPSAQRLGLGCAVAVAVDATIVRLILVPASMRLFGRWNWWFPGGAATNRAGYGTVKESP